MNTIASSEPEAAPLRRAEALAGVLIGTAVGDSIGLPMEGLSNRRQRRLFPGPLKHRLIGPVGMISDDTEHTIMVAQSLLESPSDPARFQRCLARKFRWWLIGLPAGVGFATMRAILKLWLGFPPGRSGVMSAGNGPAMRSALLGMYFAEDEELRREFVSAGTLLTHRDPRAKVGALAVAETAAWMIEADDNVDNLHHTLTHLDSSVEWQSLVEKLRTGHLRSHSVAEFSAEIGATYGVSGYVYQTVPIAIYASLRHRGDFRTALTEAIACGGDTDTVGAIVGALVGCRVGPTGIPEEWLSRLVDWPRSVALLRKLSERLDRQMETSSIQGAVSYCWPIIPLRNLVFFAIVLCHGLRRLLPPY